MAHTHSVSLTVKGSWANLYSVLYVKFMYSPVCADHDDVMVMYIGCHHQMGLALVLWCATVLAYITPLSHSPPNIGCLLYLLVCR